MQKKLLHIPNGQGVEVSSNSIFSLKRRQSYSIPSNCPAFRGTVPIFGPKFTCPNFSSFCPTFSSFYPRFTAFFSTNLSLDLIILSYFYQICKNVPLLDQKSCFFRNFVPLFASGRLVGMLFSLCEIIWPMPRGLTNQWYYPSCTYTRLLYTCIICIFIPSPPECICPIPVPHTETFSTSIIM